VLASLAIFIFGIVAILNFFPSILRAENEAVLMSAAAMLGQMKAAEIRRDDLSESPLTPLADLIAQRATPTEPIQFPREPRLAYSFCGRSLLDPVDDPGDPADDFDVARVIVIKWSGTVPPTLANVADWEIYAEYRFDGGIIP
jgi:hypothetical protein